MKNIILCSVLIILLSGLSGCSKDERKRKSSVASASTIGMKKEPIRVVPRKSVYEYRAMPRSNYRAPSNFQRRR